MKSRKHPHFAGKMTTLRKKRHKKCGVGRLSVVKKWHWGTFMKYLKFPVL